MLDIGLADAKSRKHSPTNLIAAVAFAVKTISKCSGSALKNAKVFSRIESTMWPESCEGSDVE